MFYYKAEPAMRPLNPTVKEIVDEVGLEGLFEKTNVDELTQKALYYFFEYDRICDYDKDKFMWFWRRRLYRYYPVYQNQLEMWTKRKTYDWFFDLNKGYKLTHDGTFSLDEKTKEEIEKEVDGYLKSVFGDTKTLSENTTDEYSESGSNQSTDNHSGIVRDLMFNYPESNYTGGVIPYDLDYEKNPMNVEFLNTQEDKVDSSTDTHSGSYSKTSNDKGTKGQTINDNSTKTDDKTENTNQYKDGTKNQDTETHWVETMERNEIKIDDLVKGLLDDIPRTDFFNQFVRHLMPCFMNIATFDELERF